MKKMKKKAQETVADTVEIETADDTVSIAEAIKPESKSVPKKSEKSETSDVGIFSELLKQTPMGWRNLGIAAFVRKHFKQVSFVRNKLYSWKQIAMVVESELHSGSRNLPHSLRSAFFRERHRGEL